MCEVAPEDGSPGRETRRTLIKVEYSVDWSGKTANGGTGHTWERRSIGVIQKNLAGSLDNG